MAASVVRTAGACKRALGGGTVVRLGGTSPACATPADESQERFAGCRAQTKDHIGGGTRGGSALDEAGGAAPDCARSFERTRA